MSSQNSKKIPIKTINKIIYKNRSNDIIENISRSTLIPFQSFVIQNDNFELKPIPMLIKQNKFKKLLNNVINLSSYINCASHLNSIDANLLNSLNVIHDNNDENSMKNFNQVLSDGIHNIYFSNKNKSNDDDYENLNGNNLKDINEDYDNNIYQQKNINIIPENNIMNDLKKSKILSDKIKEKKETIEINQLQLKKLIKMNNKLKETINKKNKKKNSLTPIKNLGQAEKALFNIKLNKKNMEDNQQDKTQQLKNNNFKNKKNKKEKLLKLKKNIEKIKVNSEESISFEKNDEIISNNILNTEFKNNLYNSNVYSIKESQIKQLSKPKIIKNKSFDIIDSYLD
jgi:hypothetical protein